MSTVRTTLSPWPGSSGRPARAVAGAALLALLAGASVMPLAGCRGERSDKRPRQFFPDMDDSPKWKPQSGSAFFSDGRTQRVPVEGVVPFGADAHADSAARAEMLAADDGFYRGVSGSSFLDRIPSGVSVDKDLLLLGQETYNINCSVCHGFAGDGNGTVGQRWRTTLPNFHDFKYRDLTQRTGKDGYIFDVIRHGVWDTVTVENGRVEHSGNQRMPAYTENVTEREAWAVVAWLRVMQNSRTFDLTTLPGEQRRRLEQSRPASTPAPETGPGMGEGGAEGGGEARNDADAPSEGASARADQPKTEEGVK